MENVISQIIIPYSWGSAENALITSWLVDEGAVVSEGDPIAEVSTDKVDTQLEAPASGLVVRCLVQAGTEVKMGASVALLATLNATGEGIVQALAAFDAGTLEPPVTGREEPVG